MQPSSIIGTGLLIGVAGTIVFAIGSNKQNEKLRTAGSLIMSAAFIPIVFGWKKM
jgi:hypothetical protein